MAEKQLSDTLHLMIEVVGCPTVCRHCWARGAPYHAMPTKQIEQVLEGAEKACRAAGLRLSPFPMHEVAAHPDVGVVLDLFHAHGADGLFEPFITTGVPLAVRDDWPTVLAAIGRNGGRTLWVHVHGIGETHDDTVARAGSYQDTLLAIRRATEAGLGAGANVFVTAANVGQIETVMDDLLAAGASRFSVEVSTYYPHARLRHMEAIRPTLADLRPLEPLLRERRHLNHASYIWDDIENRTEAGWYQKATGGQWDEKDNRIRQVVCRADLAVHQGAAGTYGPFIGNLSTDDPAAVWNRAVAALPTTRYDAYFGRVQEPIASLARSHGSRGGTKIHFFAQSIRAVWLDRSNHRPTTFLPVGRRKSA